VFVPRPGGEAEEDGVLLALATRADGNSVLRVLRGGSLDPLATLQLPAPVPYRFHGCFVGA
jgi:carotenoid cleavage dioxygenase-like enzyme